jgi:hypothetical protein
MNIVLITNCSASKNGDPRPSLRVSALNSDEINNVARSWYARLRRVRQKIQARRLYAGPGMAAARAAAAESEASWYVVSAGLGLVHTSRRVPAYDLTISRHGASSYVLKKVQDIELRAPDAWWKALSRARGSSSPIRRLIRRRPDALTIIALSRPYLEMVSDELCALDPEKLTRVRIVGPSDAKALPIRLRQLVMPYDARLNGSRSPFPGPMSSFVQRAARHFLQLLSPGDRDLGLRAHKNRVRAALANVSRPRRVSRRRVSDARVIQLAIRLRSRGITSPNSGLRQLRDQHHIACEQARFRRLWKLAA